MKTIKKTFFYLLGLAALLLLITLVINTSVFDEDLLPEVQAIKNIKAEPYAAGNAYPALMAISGPMGESLVADTEEVRHVLNSKIKNTGVDYLSDEEFQRLLGEGHHTEWLKTYQSCVSRTQINCMAEVNQIIEKNPTDDPVMAKLLHRYQELIAFTDYQEATQMSFDSPLISYRPSISLQKVSLAKLVRSDDKNIYIDAVLKDIKFWRMVVNESHLLITKMVAIAAVYNDISSISVAVQNKQLTVEQMRLIQHHIKEMKPAGSNWKNTFEMEFKSGIQMLEQAYEESEVGPWWETLLYQNQATQNVYYLSTFKPLSIISTYDSVRFYQHIQNGEREFLFYQPLSWSPSALYNPIGKRYALPAYEDYLARGHDVSGMVLLLKLQIELALNPTVDRQQLINASIYKNPYTLEPMDYDPKTNQISFTCMDKSSVCALQL